MVAHDLHPEYLATKYALERDGVEHVGVQHHHAHLAAVLAEHGERGTAVGAIFDGSGYGTDGSVWGGELLVGDLAGFRRAGALRAVRLPGGERAIREPWRMACAWLAAAVGENAGLPRSLASLVEPRAWEQVRRLALTGTASPVTSSIGRLFDAVAALCGLRARVDYEGQAAIELEAACEPDPGGGYPLPVLDSDGFLTLDARETISSVLADVDTGVPPGIIASRFHAGLAAATVRACAGAAAATGTELAVLSGGVFQNRRLLEAVAAGLEQARPARAVARAAPARRRRDLVRAGGGGGPAAGGGVMDTDLEQVLAAPVFVGGANRQFGKLTIEQVRGHATELRDATGWGRPRAWPRSPAPGASCRSRWSGPERDGWPELDGGLVAALAPQLWVVLPG